MIENVEARIRYKVFIKYDVACRSKDKVKGRLQSMIENVEARIRYKVFIKYDVACRSKEKVQGLSQNISFSFWKM